MKYGSEVSKLDTDVKVITLSNGEQISYDHIISTTPINLLIGMMEGTGLEPLKKKKDSFVFSSSHIIGIGLKGHFFCF